MTLEDRLSRAEWCLRSIRAKAGSSEAGPLAIAIADGVQLAADVFAVGVELAARHARAVRR